MHHLGYTKVKISIRKSWVPRFEPRATGWASVPRRPSAIRFNKKTYICFLILFLLSSLNYWMTLCLDLVVVSAGSIKNWWNKHFTEMITHQIDKNCSSKSIYWKICRILQRNNKKQSSMEIKWDPICVETSSNLTKTFLWWVKFSAWRWDVKFWKWDHFNVLTCDAKNDELSSVNVRHVNFAFYE